MNQKKIRKIDKEEGEISCLALGSHHDTKYKDFDFKREKE